MPRPSFVLDLRSLAGLAGLLGVVAALWPPGHGLAQSPKPGDDDWLTNAIPWPTHHPVLQGDPRRFTRLRAEAIAGRLKVLWVPERLETNATVTLIASLDEWGHWPARDWRSYPMSARGEGWEVNVPIEEVDLPLVYYVQMAQAGRTYWSRARMCLPRAVGLEEPTRIFWPFLEGFEETLESWRWLKDSPGFLPLHTNAQPKNGRAALDVTLPAGQRSVTVATTRVRGWQIQLHTATGLRVWLRTNHRTGQAQFSLWANAFTTNQVISVCDHRAMLGPQWQKVDLPFAAFRRLPRGQVDLFTMEFTGDGPAEFWVDDLSFLGPWRLELE